MDIEKIVIITQHTWLDGLIAKYNTKEQAKFYIEHMGGDFVNYIEQHTTYYSALRLLKQQIPSSIRYQVVEKSFLPNFLFGQNDLVVVLGRDGLVVNTAKYLHTQMVLGVNPDPERIDGILLPFSVEDVGECLEEIIHDKYTTTKISLAEVILNTGQRLVGVNDIFIGHKSHQSARYSISSNDWTEKHSSSGIIISTGVGSTGWYKSVVSSALNIANAILGCRTAYIHDYQFPWDANFLKFAVREAWKSKTTGNALTFGSINQGEELIIESHMPDGGVIFSDGIEKDKITFNSGTIARIKLADRKITLLTKK
ncbi:MAG: sugar kinase [Candidatus Heimdallarchaeota archaeon]|nr:sugar kinase [Candidatus Heimdallarchaeota archaeon]